MVHTTIKWLNTRSGYRITGVIALGLLLTIMVFLLGGNWLHELVAKPFAVTTLFFWLGLLAVCAFCLVRMKTHGTITVTKTEIIQHQLALPTKIPLADIKSYELTTSIRTVAQAGTTVRVPRLLAMVTLVSGKKVPLVLSVFSETDREKIKHGLSTGNFEQLTDKHDNQVWSLVIYFVYFALVSAIIPVVVWYGQK